MCGDNRPAGAGTSLGAPHHGHFPLGLQLRLGAPSFPRGPGFSSISSLLPPPHTPCGLEQPCYNITMCCGVGMAKLSCPQRGGALQAALGQTSGLEAPRGAGESQFPSLICHKRPLVFPLGRLFLSMDTGIPCVPERTGTPYTRLPFLCLPDTQLYVPGTFLTPGDGEGGGGCWRHFRFPELSLGRCWQKRGPSSLPRTGVRGWLWLGFSGPSTRPRRGPISFLEGPGLCRAGLTPATLSAMCETLAASAVTSIWPAVSCAGCRAALLS